MDSWVLWDANLMFWSWSNSDLKATVTKLGLLGLPVPPSFYPKNILMQLILKATELFFITQKQTNKKNTRNDPNAWVFTSKHLYVYKSKWLAQLPRAVKNHHSRLQIRWWYDLKKNTHFSLQQPCHRICPAQTRLDTNCHSLIMSAQPPGLRTTLQNKAGK